MKPRGFFFLFELLIGLLITSTLVQETNFGQSVKNQIELARDLCHNLAGVWTYGNEMDEIVAVSGNIAKIRWGDETHSHEKNSVTCHAQRIKKNKLEEISIIIEPQSHFPFE